MGLLSTGTAKKMGGSKMREELPPIRASYPPSTCINNATDKESPQVMG